MEEGKGKKNSKVKDEIIQISLDKQKEIKFFVFKS